MGSIGVFLANASVGGSTTAYLAAGLTLTVGNLSVTANSQHLVTSNTVAAVIGGLAGGGTNSTTTVTEDVEAYLGSPASSAPNATPSSYTPSGSVTVKATANNDGTAQAIGGLAGGIGASGNVANATVTPTVRAYENDDVNLTTTGNVTISATATNTTWSNIVGAVLAGIGVAVSEASATDGATVAAYVGAVTLTVGGNLAISATSSDIATTDSQAYGGSFEGGTGAVANSTINPNVQAYAGVPSTQNTSTPTPKAVINVAGTATITATETPDAKAVGSGVSASIACSVGVVQSDATVAGSGTTGIDPNTTNVTAASYLGANTTFTAGSLTIEASQQQDANNDPTAWATTTPSVGVAVLVGVNCVFSAASTSGSVVAGTGSNVSLNGGGVSIGAQNTTNQNAWAHGEAASVLLAVGDCSSNASSNVTTNAFLGAGSTMGSQADPDGALAITATGSDSNAAASTAGAGAVFSGDCAHAWTADDSTVTAGADSGATIYANQVTIRADKSSAFTPNVNAINASVVGGSGAKAWTNDSTSATAVVGDSAAITATGTVAITASNTFTENTSGPSVQTGSGGVINGSSAQDHTTIGGTNSDGQNNNDTASVIVGEDASITSGSDLDSSPGGITIGASSSVTAIDSITQSAGGAVEILYDIDQIDVTLNNMVSIGQRSKLFSYGNIGIGTTTTIDAETTALLHTYGFAGGGTADAYTNATSNQTVTVGQNAAITAVGNINLTAGTDPTGLTPSTMTASSDAYAQAEGLAGVPYANPGTTATSNATLNVNSGATINSGEDTTVGAYPGSPDATQIETTEGSVFWVTTNNGGTLTTVTPTTSSQFTNDGTITAGYYHELTIDIPKNQQNAGSYSSAITVNPDGSPSLITPAELASDYNPNFNVQNFVANNFVDSEKTMLAGSVSSGDVGAFDLSQNALFASGGSVTVNAGTIAGSGTIVAWGGPTVTITNESPDYLILGAIGIPDLSGGNVNFTGTGKNPSTMTVNQNQNQSTSIPTVTITLSSASGPALFLTGPIDNLGGTVSITNSYGSIGQIAAISGLTVNMSSPNGSFDVSEPTEDDPVGSDPIAAWNSFMTWPGGSSTASASAAAANLNLGTYQ